MLLVLLMIAVLPLKQGSFWTADDRPFNPLKYLGAACVIYAVGYVLRRPRAPLYFHTWQARLCVPYMLLIYAAAVRSRTSISTVLAVTSLVALYFVILSVVDTLKRLRWVVWASIASLGWASLYTLREWQTARGWTTGYRAGWVVGDGNGFAPAAIFGITLAWYTMEVRTSLWETWFCRVCLILTVAALVAGGSRGGLLGLAAAAVFVSLRSVSWTTTLLMAVTLLGFNVLYPYSPLQRLLHPSDIDIASTMAHKASWQAGLGMVAAHPIVGVGLGIFKSEMVKYQPEWYTGGPSRAHNAFISVAAELGIPAFLLFVGIIITAYLSLQRTLNEKFAPQLVIHTARALQAALVGSVVAISSIPAEYNQHFWLIIILSMCLPHLARRLRRRAAFELRPSPEPSCVYS